MYKIIKYIWVYTKIIILQFNFWLIIYSHFFVYVVFYCEHVDSLWLYKKKILTKFAYMFFFLISVFVD
jgi:hypothetical protein